MKFYSPARILIWSFLGTILLGAILLWLPISSSAGKSIGFLNALFTSTSAVCVTGLIVLDTAKDFSTFGQTVILVLIQLGGLGIMTFSTAIFLFLKGNLSLKEKLYLKEDTNQINLENIGTFLKNLILVTFIAESLGAVLLFIAFKGDFPTSTALYHAIFHSISAFCNAGFSTFSNSLVNYQSSTLVNLTICFLIIIGGIGFLLIQDLLSYREKKFLSLHTKIVLWTTLILLLIGTIFYFFFELKEVKLLGWKTHLLTSFFQSTTTRTAGFNTVDLGKLSNSTIFIFILLMIIGASPGSTGGGIKTTTFSLLFLSIISTLKNKEDVVLNKKMINSESVKKAFILTSLYLITSAAFILLLLYFESEFSFQKVVFELISAIGTVGLSLGVTPYLSNAGKIIIIIAMFIGRVGPLTLISGLSFETQKTKIKYPEEKISIG